MTDSDFFILKANFYNSDLPLYKNNEYQIEDKEITHISFGPWL